MATYNLVHAVFDRSQLSPDEDDAIFTMHIRQVVAAAPDILPITDQGRDDFVQNFNTFWEAIDQYVTQQIRLTQLRFYDVQSGPGIDMGDPVRVVEYNNVGTGSSGPLPPQVAVSVTFKTAHRLRWGRFYLPGPTRAMCDNSGRLDPVAAQDIANAAAALANRGGTGAALTVFSRKHWNHEDVEQVQVDDIFDVIRRRRFSAPHVRKTAQP